MIQIRQENRTKHVADILLKMEAALEEVFAYYKFGRHESTFLQKPYFLLSHCAHLLFSLWLTDEDSGRTVFLGTPCPVAFLADLDYASLRHVDGASHTLPADSSEEPLKNEPQWFDFWMTILNRLGSSRRADSQEFSERVLAPAANPAFLDGKMPRRDRRAISRLVKNDQVVHLLLHSMSILEDAIWAMTSYLATLDSREHVLEQVLALTCLLREIRRTILFETPARGPYVPFEAKGWAMPSPLSRLCFGKTRGILSVLLRREGGSVICTYGWASGSVQKSRSWTFGTPALKGTYEQALFRTWSYDTGECLRDRAGPSDRRACWMVQSAEAGHLRAISRHAEALLSALRQNPACGGLVEAVTGVVGNDTKRWTPMELPWTYVSQLDHVLEQLRSVCREAAITDGDNSAEKLTSETWPVQRSKTIVADPHLSEGLQQGTVPCEAQVPPDANVGTVADGVVARSSADAGPAEESEPPVPCGAPESSRLPMPVPSDERLVGDLVAQVSHDSAQDSLAGGIAEEPNLTETDGQGEHSAPARRPSAEADAPGGSDMETTRVNTGCCDTELHTEHLCYIVSQGFHLRDEQAYRALIEKPTFKCRHCGRAASSDKNLCVPAKL